MNKKIFFPKTAFTLIELLAVIIVISLLVVIVTPITYNLINKTKEDSYLKLIDIIESSARLYVSQHLEEVSQIIEEEGIYKISLDELKSNNLLNEELKDPRNDEPILGFKQVWVIKKSPNSEAFFYFYEDRERITSNLYYGDVNGDGKITNEDAELILRYIVGLADFKEWQKERADVNLDGVVNVSDAILVLRYLTGLEPALPINKSN